jgi:predicted ATPase/class 3 adenylate cyclase
MIPLNFGQLQVGPTRSDLRFTRRDRLSMMPDPSQPDQPLPGQQPAPPRLPTGSVTFLMTDVEGSTRLWEREPEAVSQALVDHDELIEKAVEAQGGFLIRPRGEGDSRFAVFSLATGAVTAAGQIQRLLAAEPWPTSEPVRVRIALHSGEADLRLGDYYGSAVNRCARLRGIGHGGQTLLSLATVQLIGDELPPGASLLDMGLHRLRDLTRPEHVFQLLLDGLPADFPPLKSLEAYAHNLPALATPLIGRQQEVAAVIDLIGRLDVRLVTLTGTGGVGKTTLSLQAGSELVDVFAGGVYFVPLAEATSTYLVVSKIARELEVHESGGEPLLLSLKRYLANKQLLLLLDNFEHVVTAAGVVAELLAAAPGLKALVTSRTLLNVRGEHDFPVPPLALPEVDQVAGRETLGQFAAVRLFVDRARAANPRFSLTDENAHIVAEICRRLDGLPLAIELAAARIRLLPPDALLARLGDRLRLLTGGARDLPLRQQALRSTIDWSHELLGRDEQDLFAQLSVFVGGFTLETAEAVCHSDEQLDVLAGVTQLLNQSLLRQVEMPGGELRFRMLETIREYSHERLAESGRLAELQHRHGSYFAEQMVSIAYKTLSADATAALHWIDVERDNVRAALSWSLSSPEGRDLAPTLVNALYWYWYRRGFVNEGREWSERALAAHAGSGNTPARADALVSCASMAMWQGDLHSALGYIEECIEVWRHLDENISLAVALMIGGVVHVNRGSDAQAQLLLHEAETRFKEAGLEYFQAVTLVHLANASLGRGEYEAAGARLEQALAMARRLDEPWLLAFALNNQGELARAQGQHEVGHSFYAQSEALLRDLGEVGDLARLVHTLGYSAQHQGDPERAGALFRESLAMFQRVGNQRGIAECLAGLAGLAAVQDRPQDAARIMAAASALQDRGGAAWWPADRVEVKRCLTLLEDALDPANLQAAWSSGLAMTMEQAIEWVNSGGRPDPQGAPWFSTPETL